MGSLESQFKHVVRRLMRAPMFTALTLITLALGIGANTAIFSVVSGVLLKPLSYPDPDALVAVWQTAPGLGFPQVNASPSTYFTYREESQTFRDIGIWQGGSVSVTGVGEPEQVESRSVTEGVLTILGVQPIRGRRFTAKDDSPGSPGTAILSFSYWERRFGSDPSVIGRTLLVDGWPCEVIGIMPQSFRFLNSRPSLYLPMRFNRSDTFIGNFSYQAIARLKPGMTIAQANADVARMIPMLPKKFPPAKGLSLAMFEQAKFGPNVRPLMQDVVGDVGKILWVLMATVGMVLFIACANVANLLLVRAEGRQQELAVRAALGAGWSRIARELLFESVLLGLAGGALGVGVAAGALRLLKSSGSANLPRLDEISLDPSVLLFALAVSLAGGLLFGLMPVIKYAGPSLETILRRGGRTASEGRERHRARSTLVVVQVALALVLLVGSGLMIRTLQALKRVQPGFTQPEAILTLRVSIPGAQVKEPERVARMYHDMLQKIAVISGVTSAGLSNSITMDGSNNNDPIWLEDRPDTAEKLPPIRRFKHISPDFFQTMGRPLVAGRDFTWTDIHEMRPVAILSENLAREYWSEPGAALGKRIRENPKGIWREVVGVARNEHDDGVHQKAPAVVYWPMLKKSFWATPVDVRRTLSFAIRSNRTGTPGFLKEVQQTIWSVNSNLPIANVRTVQEIYGRSMARTSFTFVMLSIAAGLALLLGVVGIYGVVSYSVSQRTREIGIRMALGAPQQKVRQMFLRHGLLLASIGVACGLAAAIPLARLMSTLLFEVGPLDPATYGAVSVVLVAAALLATYVPARRATAVDPVHALRAE